MRFANCSGALCAAMLFVFVSAQALAQELPALDADGRAAALPIVHESLRVMIDNQHASTVVRRTYKNQSERQLEGVFEYRVGDGALVDGFAYYNGNQKIVGEVFERNLARGIYDDTVRPKRDPGFLESAGEGSFTFRVFPIRPFERKRVELRLDQWLPRRGGWIEYRMPVGSATLRANLDIHDARPIRRIVSATHAIGLQRDVGHVRVSIGDALGNPRELVLRYELDDEPWKLAAQVHRDPGADAYVVLSLVPSRIHEPSEPRDVTLVIDCSRSMESAGLDRAREVAARIIGRLKPSDRLDVIAFADEAVALFGRPEPVSNDNRRAALAFLHELEDGGGSNLVGALRLALDKHDGQPIVVLLSDGQVGKGDALELLRQRSEAKILAAGLGPAVDKPLLSRLTQLSGGRFLLIESPQAIDRSVSALFSSMRAPVLTDVELHAKGGRIHRRYPEPLGNLFDGDELRVVARLAAEGPVTLRLRGRHHGKPIEIEKRIVIPKRAARPWVKRLWAHERVSFLLEGIRAYGESSERENEVIELALRHNLVTPYTAFLAIPESELTASTAERLSSARAEKRRILAGARYQGQAATGLDALCKIDPDNCARIDMDELARRDVRGEIYAVQQSGPGGGCASCAVGTNHGRGIAGWAWLAIALWIGRRVLRVRLEHSSDHHTRNELRARGRRRLQVQRPRSRRCRCRNRPIRQSRSPRRRAARCRRR